MPQNNRKKICCVATLTLVLLIILTIPACGPTTSGRHSLVLGGGAEAQGPQTGRIATPPGSPIYIFYVDGFPGSNPNPFGTNSPKTFTGGRPPFTDIAVSAGKHEIIFGCALPESKGLSPLQALSVDMGGGEIITIQSNPGLPPKALETCDVLVRSNLRGMLKGAVKEYEQKKQ